MIGTELSLAVMRDRLHGPHNDTCISSIWLKSVLTLITLNKRFCTQPRNLHQFITLMPLSQSVDYGEKNKDEIWPQNVRNCILEL